MLKTKAAQFLLLTAYQPDRNLTETAFSKLTAHLRAAGIRTSDAVWWAIGSVCHLFSPRECWNELAAAGYTSNKRSML